MDIIEMLQIAKQRVAVKPSSPNPFEVKDLFTGDEWNLLGASEKRQFGFLFSKEQKEGENSSIAAL